jgi:hypothetical protein
MDARIQLETAAASRRLVPCGWVRLRGQALNTDSRPALDTAFMTSPGWMGTTYPMRPPLSHPGVATYDWQLQEVTPGARQIHTLKALKESATASQSSDADTFWDDASLAQQPLSCEDHADTSSRETRLRLARELGVPALSWRVVNRIASCPPNRSCSATACLHSRHPVKPSTSVGGLCSDRYGLLGPSAEPAGSWQASRCTHRLAPFRGDT